MNVVASSGWLESFVDDETAEFFVDPIEQEDALVVPTIGIYEVLKHVLREAGRDEALRAVALMKKGRTVEFYEPFAEHPEMGRRIGSVSQDTVAKRP